MLLCLRLYPKGGLGELWKLIEAQKRNLFSEGVMPLFAQQMEGREYIGINMDVQRLELIQSVFLKNIGTMISVDRTKTIPLIHPVFFPMPRGHPRNLERYQVFLKVSPDKYDEVKELLMSLDYPKDIVLTYLSFSFGDDDIILSFLARDRESITKFVNDRIRTIDGVEAFEIARVVKLLNLCPEDQLSAYNSRFLFSVPAGKKGRMRNPKAYAKYIAERSTSTVIVRLFPKKSLEELWKEIEREMPRLETKEVVPLYASQQEAKGWVAVIFETQNLEALGKCIISKLPRVLSINKTRTIPMVEPTYFLLPKKHPKNLKRYLVSIRTDPRHYQSIYSQLISYPYPPSTYLTYITYTLGDDDILLSILTDRYETAEELTKKVAVQIEGIKSYDLSSQVKTKRLTSRRRWEEHLSLFLSSYDKIHQRELDRNYQWPEDFYEHAALTGAFKHDLED
ncbi:MAG: Lrp/AsnC ligand binding domain-containing protein [Thermoplasmata archaeon]